MLPLDNYTIITLYPSGPPHASALSSAPHHGEQVRAEAGLLRVCPHALRQQPLRQRVAKARPLPRSQRASRPSKEVPPRQPEGELRRVGQQPGEESHVAAAGAEEGEARSEPVGAVEGVVRAVREIAGAVSLADTTTDDMDGGAESVK